MRVYSIYKTRRGCIKMRFPTAGELCSHATFAFRYTPLPFHIVSIYTVPHWKGSVNSRYGKRKERTYNRAKQKSVP